MILLGMDTSSLACAVGVQDGERLVTRHAEQAREHTKLLLPMIRSTLAGAGLAVADLGGIVLGNGPGSFIGVRIAASVAQGLAFGRGIGIVPVSSMAAVAVAAGTPGATVAVAQDAHMQQAYFGLYRIDDAGAAVTVCAERLQCQERIAELAHRSDIIAAGAGWERYPGLLDRNEAHIACVSDVKYPTAAAILGIGVAAFSAGGAISPDRLDPAYLRDDVAHPHRPNARNSSVT